MIELNLQFFAKEGPGGEKTEEPTSKKLDDARKEGQVGKSKEVANAAGLVALFLLLRITLSFIGNNFLGIFSAIYNRLPEMVTFYGGYVPEEEIVGGVRYALLRSLIIMLPFLFVGFIVAFFSNSLQFKWKVTTKPMQPKLSKLNPISGFKKIFSVQSLMELFKSIAKIALIVYVVYSEIRDKYDVIYLLFNMPLWQGVMTAGDIAISIGFKVSIFYIVLAAIDFAYQKYKFKEDQKMTKQEVKDEYKNAEGDPAIKGKIRQKMQEASRRRMMQAVPTADVVITNPTHYAVALKYDKDLADAPVVVAKGEDYLAAKIKELARDNRVEIVENKPLARMLYHNVEVGEAVPPELYQAVAEILAMVYHQQGRL